MRKKSWLAAVLAGTLSAPVASQSDHPAMHLHHATGWINSTPLTADDVRGKVVLVDFWTYTCINWLRTAPYARAWADKYRDAGLVAVGVHTPEFEFEKAQVNVQAAVPALDILSGCDRQRLWRLARISKSSVASALLGRPRRTCALPPLR
jgi:thiol-disulfide isomerase/thioredoxin